jgi:hypothetical protein
MSVTNLACEHYARTTRLWHDWLFANRAAAETEVGSVKV